MLSGLNFQSEDLGHCFCCETFPQSTQLSHSQKSFSHILPLLRAVSLLLCPPNAHVILPFYLGSSSEGVWLSWVTGSLLCSCHQQGWNPIKAMKCNLHKEPERVTTHFCGLSLQGFKSCGLQGFLSSCVTLVLCTKLIPTPACYGQQLIRWRKLSNTSHTWEWSSCSSFRSALHTPSFHSVWEELGQWCSRAPTITINVWNINNE